MAQSTFRSQHVKNTRSSDHFWRFRCRLLRFTTLHYTHSTLHNTTTTATQLHSTTLNYTTLHCTTLHYLPVHSTTLHLSILSEVANHCVFPMIWGSGGSKSRLAKAAGAEPAGKRRGEKLHAVVARSRFRSQNVQNTPWSDHFWKLRCRKSVRRCG